MNLRPLGKRIIVETVKEETTTNSGLILTQERKTERHRVVAVGGNVTEVKVDELIHCHPAAGVPVKLENNEYRLIEVGDVQGVYE